MPGHRDVHTRPVVRIGGIAFSYQLLWIAGVSLLMVALLALFFAKTRAGKAMRACAINRDAAALQGIPVERMLAYSFALSAALGAVTAAVVGVILNLAVWFALQVLFAKHEHVRMLGATVDVPVLASANIASMALAACASTKRQLGPRLPHSCITASSIQLADSTSPSTLLNGAKPKLPLAIPPSPDPRPDPGAGRPGPDPRASPQGPAPK